MGDLDADVALVVAGARRVSAPAKILFTIPNFITAGSGRAMLNIVERLDRTRFDPSIAVLKRGGKLDAEVERLGIPLLEHEFTTPARPYHTLPGRTRRLAAPFRAHRFALWHSFHYGDDYSEPLIAHASGARGWIYTKKNMNWHANAWHLRSLLARRIAAQNTDMMRDFFARIAYRSKTRLIPRGVDTAKFSPSAQPRLRLREQLAIPADATVITSVAQLLPVKGHPVLLLAAASVKDAHLLLAGSDVKSEYADSLRGQAKRHGVSDRVHFLGRVDDVPALLAETDIFALATRAHGHEEGCPVALLEAMAAGRACIATDVAGSRDLIVNGQSGILIPSGDPLAMGQAIERLAKSPGDRRRLGHAALTRVMEHYTIDHEVRAHEALYAEALGA
jgi:glycosyltransferase involved in cell wall biosynthesis